MKQITSPRRLHGDVRVTQMALAALDNVARRGRRGTGGSALLVVPQAALLLNGDPVDHLHGGETLLARAAILALAHTTLTSTLLVSQDRSARRQLSV